MKNLKNLTLIVICLLSFSLTQTHAQKFGYLNSMNLLQELPETTAADKQLEAAQKDVTAKGQEMVKAFEADYQVYMQKAQSGSLSQVQQQQEEAKLTKQRDEIAKYEQTAMADVQKKRQELLEPIVAKLNEAIAAVGKEKGYSMIFDESAGAILFNLESDDVTGLVKAKLGI